MKRTFKKLGIIAIACGFAFAAQTSASAASLDITNVDGDWTNAQPPGLATIVNSGPNGGISSIRWGTPTDGDQSGYDFISTPTPFNVEADGTPFALGDFNHHNQAILDGTSITSVDLDLNVADLGIFDVSATFDFTHDETPNTSGGPADNDLISITNPIVNELFTYDGNDYYFNLIGFSVDGGATIKTFFTTSEGQDNFATLYGQITPEPVSDVPEPATLMLFGGGIAGLLGMMLRRDNKA